MRCARDRKPAKRERLFSWIEYPDKATRDAANEKMSADPEAMEMEMPFDSRRMFWGGFQQVVDE